MLPVIRVDICRGCGECAAACPENVLKIETSVVFIDSVEECGYCGECEAACERGGILCPISIKIV